MRVMRFKESSASNVSFFFLEIIKLAFLKPFQDSLLTFILKISFIKDKPRLAYRSRKIYDLFHILFHIFISYTI